MFVRVVQLILYVASSSKLDHKQKSYGLLKCCNFANANIGNYTNTDPGVDGWWRGGGGGRITVKLEVSVQALVPCYCESMPLINIFSNLYISRSYEGGKEWM